MAINYVDEWYYVGQSEGAFAGSGDGKYCWNGYSNYNSSYYTYVAKFETTTAIQNPIVNLHHAGTANTSESKWLGAYFVQCEEDELPDTSIFGQNLESLSQTRLAFGKTWNGQAFESSNGLAVGKAPEVTLKKGYFFLYISHGGATGTDKHTYSSIRVCTTTLNPLTVTATEITNYTISYDSNGGEGLMEPTVKEHGIAVELKQNEFEPPEGDWVLWNIVLNGAEETNTRYVSNYIPVIFDSWNTSPDGDGITYFAGQKYEIDEDIILYAHWTEGPAQKEEIVLGESYLAPQSEPVSLSAKLYDEVEMSYNLQKTIPNTFKEWNTSQNGTGESYSADKPYSFDSDTELYAIYDTNLIYPEVELPFDIIRDGYIFKNWTDSNSENVIDGILVLYEDTSIRADWEIGPGAPQGMYIYSKADSKWYRVASFGSF